MDHLSQRPDYDTGSTDNEDITVLPPHLFINATDLLSVKQHVYDEQGEHKKQMKNLQKEHPLNLVNQKWFNQGWPVVPDNEDLKREILRHFHDHKLAGHPGIANTMMAVMWEFWWPEIQQFTTAYVRGCAICQSTKPNTVHPKPPMLPIIHEQQQYPFQTITMDLITDLPASRGYNSILTIINQGCTKAAVFLPCHKTINAVGIASLYA